MKILYVCADRGIPLLGDKGASVHVRSITAALARRGHMLTLACRTIDGRNGPPHDVRVVPMPPEEERHQQWLTQLLRKSEAEVLLERYSLSSGPGLKAARRLAIPFVLEVNAPLVEEAARYRGLQQVDSWRARERRLLAAADRVIAVSSGIRDYAVAAGVAPDRAAIVANGVDIEAFKLASGADIRRRYALEHTVVVGFLGSLKPWHGVVELVRAFAVLPPTSRLLVVGDGPARGAVEAEAHKQGIGGRVVLTGAVPHADVPAYLAAMDIAVAPYLPQPDFYFSPLKVAEYLAAGLPVIASASGDLPALLREAGLLVPAGDVDALAEAMLYLVGDGRRRRRLAASALTCAPQFSWDRAAEHVEAVLRNAVPAALRSVS